jgi:hypothetical protein
LRGTHGRDDVGGDLEGSCGIDRIDGAPVRRQQRRTNHRVQLETDLDLTELVIEARLGRRVRADDLLDVRIAECGVKQREHGRLLAGTLCQQGRNGGRLRSALGQEVPQVLRAHTFRFGLRG